MASVCSSEPRLWQSNHSKSSDADESTNNVYDSSNDEDDELPFDFFTGEPVLAGHVKYTEDGQWDAAGVDYDMTEVCTGEGISAAADAICSSRIGNNAKITARSRSDIVAERTADMVETQGLIDDGHTCEHLADAIEGLLPRPHWWPWLLDIRTAAEMRAFHTLRSKWSMTMAQEATCIRILSIDAAEAGDSDELRCHLHLTSLEQPCKYQALSYAWGTEEPTAKIYIDGLIVHVKPTLKAALLQIRKHWSGDSDLKCKENDRCLWVDALCITQVDHTEKGAQVQLMDQVYSKAKCVLIWLGEHHWNDAADSLHSPGAKPFDADRDINEYLGNDYFIRWLSELPWFSRLWTLQELLLQERRWLLYGTWLFTFSALIAFVAGSPNPPAGLLRYFENSDWSLSSTRLTHKRNHLSTYIEFHERLCGDLRDRIYAIRSISSDGFDFSVNYEEDIRWTYLRFSAQYACSEWLPTVLIAATTMSKRHSNFPSWAICPYLYCVHKSSSGPQSFLGFRDASAERFFNGDTARFTCFLDHAEPKTNLETIRLIGYYPELYDIYEADVENLPPILQFQAWTILACIHKLGFRRREKACVHCSVTKALRRETSTRISQPDAYFILDSAPVVFTLVWVGKRGSPRQDQEFTMPYSTLRYSFALSDLRIKLTDRKETAVVDMLFERGGIKIRNQVVYKRNVRLV